MDELMAVCAGVGLAAACGFRVFVPLFVASLAANTGVDLPMIPDQSFQDMLGSSHAWMGNDLITFSLGTATVFEVGAYYVPWLDNILDSIATPAAVVAGTFVSGAMMPELFGDGSFKWVAAMIAGGGTAGIVQGASVITRGASTATTGGLGNPAVSTAELGGSILTAGLAILVPVIAALLVLVLFFFALRAIIRFFRRKSANNADPDPGRLLE